MKRRLSASFTRRLRRAGRSAFRWSGLARLFDVRNPDAAPLRAQRWGHRYREIAARGTFFDQAFKALSYNGISGDYLEFGSHGASTFRLAWNARNTHGHSAHLWAFDSFEGLPPGVDSADAHPEWQQGKMATSIDAFVGLCADAGISGQDCTVIPGFYSESLTRSEALYPSKVALAFVDCDLYSSTKEVLSFLEPRLEPGVIIAFDDYFCWTRSGPSGEQRAFEEFLGDLKTWRAEPYVQFGWHGQSFVLFRST